MFQRWPKRDPNKHYYLVPNEVFNLGLSSHEIAVYNYLLRCPHSTADTCCSCSSRSSPDAGRATSFSSGPKWRA